MDSRARHASARLSTPERSGCDAPVEGAGGQGDNLVVQGDNLVVQGDNLVVQGDNLTVLAKLAEERPASFACVYLDPPFNTGRTFEAYRDRLGAAAWAAMMRPRLALLRDLLAPSGALVAEIDDTELGTLLGLLDEIFGREQRLPIVTVVRSAATGHKARNKGPVNVTDYLLIYARDRARLAVQPLDRPRRGYDHAYRLFVPNREDAPEAWRFEPLGRTVAVALGFGTVAQATRRLGRSAFERELAAFALARPRHVARLAQPRFEAISVAAREAVRSSRARPETTVVLTRLGHPPLYLRGGNRVLFLDRKVRVVDGEATLVEALTNVWDDVPFQGIAAEGGVRFVRNKKPERLLMRVLQLFSKPGDWVLDPFLGSGTTAAVAHKMQRRYVGIEQSEEMVSKATERLRAVVEGRDARGITRDVGFTGGGSFAVVR